MIKSGLNGYCPCDDQGGPFPREWKATFNRDGSDRAPLAIPATRGASLGSVNSKSGPGWLSVTHRPAGADG